MDYKNTANKEHLSTAKNQLMTDFSQLFDELIDSPEKYKKAALLYYWLRDYKNYIKNEDKFDCCCLPNYKRGDVVNINFGFNLGSEQGGLHYGIVMADSGKRNPVLTVVPLRSSKPENFEHTHHTEVNLGNELFDKLTVKSKTLDASIDREIATLKKKLEEDGEVMVKISQILDTGESSEETTKVSQLIEQIQRSSDMMTSKIEMLHAQSEVISKTSQKLTTMKHGSIAMLSQIRCISKMRVMDPTNEYDTLYKIKLSAEKLNIIDKKLVFLYTNQIDKKGDLK